MSNRRRPITFVVAGLCDPPYQGAGGKDVQWVKVQSDLNKSGSYTDVRLRFVKDGRTWKCAGLLVVTEGELTLSEISERFPFAALNEWAVEGLATITKTEPPRVTEPRRLGRRGSSDEFYRQVAAKVTWAMGQPDHRRNYVMWLRQERDLWTEAQLKRAEALEAEGRDADEVVTLAAPPYETVKTWLRTARTTIDPTTGKTFLPNTKPARKTKEDA